jgi:transcriptional regulator NrdR family protein
MKAARSSRDELGIRCPRCACRHFKTTHTEPLRDGRIRRRKVCRHCGRKIVTFEASPTVSQQQDRYR